MGAAGQNAKAFADGESGETRIVRAFPCPRETMVLRARGMFMPADAVREAGGLRTRSSRGCDPDRARATRHGWGDLQRAIRSALPRLGRGERDPESSTPSPSAMLQQGVEGDVLFLPPLDLGVVHRVHPLSRWASAARETPSARRVRRIVLPQLGQPLLRLGCQRELFPPPGASDPLSSASASHESYRISTHRRRVSGRSGRPARKGTVLSVKRIFLRVGARAAGVFRDRGRIGRRGARGMQ